jgi:tetratricopeptide (TPR) repeat protein
MMLQDSYQDLYSRAQNARLSGRHEEAIGGYTRIVERLSELSRETLGGRPDLEQLLQRAAEELVEVLRWERRYDQAIELEERMIARFPEEEMVRQTEIANLLIERGQVEDGLSRLKGIAEKDAGNIWVWITLGAQYLWLRRYDEGEPYLKHAAELSQATDADRAFAYRYLFELYKEQDLLDEALTAWEAARGLDPEVQATLPEMYGMFIEAGDYRQAHTYLRREQNRLRYLFHLGLIDHRQGDEYAAQRQWRRLADMDPANYEDGQDAWAEACFRSGLIQRGLTELARRINQGEISLQRMKLLGLGWALEGDAGRAKAALDAAVMLLDHSRPRRSKLPRRDWRLFEELTQDKEVLEALKDYFAPPIFIPGQDFNANVLPAGTLPG